MPQSPVQLAYGVQGDPEGERVDLSDQIDLAALGDLKGHWKASESTVNASSNRVLPDVTGQSADFVQTAGATIALDPDPQIGGESIFEGQPGLRLEGDELMSAPSFFRYEPGGFDRYTLLMAFYLEKSGGALISSPDQGRPIVFLYSTSGERGVQVRHDNADTATPDAGGDVSDRRAVLGARHYNNGLASDGLGYDPAITSELTSMRPTDFALGTGQLERAPYTGNLQLCTDAGGVTVTGWFGELIYFNEVLTGHEWELAKSYMKMRYNVAPQG